VLQSLGDERNKIYTLPLLPFILIFGQSRLVYEISLALVYLVPFSLSMGAVATQLIQANPVAVFWSTALSSLLIPVSWSATFLGIPDTGAAALIALAAFVYLKDVRLKQWWRIPVIGFCLGLAILLRRHFVYGAIAFLGAITIQTLIFFVVEMRKSRDVVYSVATRGYNVSSWRNLQLVGVRIGLITAICFAILMTVAGEFTQRAMTTDYRNLYASWSLPLDNVVSLYVAFYGWITLLLVAIGFSAGVLTHVLSLPSFSFIWLFGIFSLIEWLIVLRYGNVFYSLHLTPVVVMGLAAFIWTTYLKLTGKVRTLMLSVAGCYLVCNLVIGITPIGSFNRPLRPLFALNIPPLVRTDYNEVARLVEYLRQLVPNKEPIYIVGSQRLHLNRSTVRAAERILYGYKQDILLLLGAPQVDSQDFYPLEKLLQAQYVVLPNPLPDYNFDFTKVPAVGEWLPLKESDVVKVVLDAFEQNWQIAQDFKRLPVKFTLADGASVNIYQRIRPTSLQTAVQTLTAMQKQIGERPGGQLDWMSLSQRWNYSLVVKNSDRTYRLLTYPIERAKTQARSFLYLGSLSENAVVTGRIKIFGKSCSASLKLKTLDRKGEIISTTKN
ncbi:MAG TPA: hypothetical protein DEV81_06190, partial [Cyanobacteria bacterium UBA11049]|nr:hypothetical protein [Cyanobacteria bacterium UBA11049]